MSIPVQIKFSRDTLLSGYSTISEVVFLIAPNIHRNICNWMDDSDDPFTLMLVINQLLEDYGIEYFIAIGDDVYTSLREAESLLRSKIREREEH